MNYYTLQTFSLAAILLLITVTILLIHAIIAYKILIKTKGHATILII